VGHCLARWPQQELSFTSNVDISQTPERSFHAHYFARFVGGYFYRYRHACCSRFRTGCCRYPRWRCESGARPRPRPVPIQRLRPSVVSQLRSRMPHYHHPPRRRIGPSDSALRLSITDAPWLEAIRHPIGEGLWLWLMNWDYSFRSVANRSCVLSTLASSRFLKLMLHVLQCRHKVAQLQRVARIV